MDRSCPQCGIPLPAEPVVKEITRTVVNQTTRKMEKDTRQIDFCSAVCGNAYQFIHENPA